MDTFEYLGMQYGVIAHVDCSHEYSPAAGTAASTGDLLSMPKVTRIAGRRVKSWHPEVLVGTSQDQMRDASIAIIKGTDHHPLERGELVGVPEEVPRVGAVVTHHPDQRGAVRAPVRDPQCVGRVRIEREMRCEVLGHRAVDVREDVRPRIV